MSSRPIALLSCLVALAASTASAQTVANGQYYATPSWDQTLPTATRFVVLANMKSDAVLDRETGLVWQRAPMAAKPYSESLKDCQDAQTGGRMGWRLPSVVELTTLFDPAVASGSYLRAGGFTGLPDTPVIFWTTTAYNSAGVHYGVDTGPPVVRVDPWPDSVTRSVLCVRGPDTGR